MQGVSANLGDDRNTSWAMRVTVCTDMLVVTMFRSSGMIGRLRLLMRMISQFLRMRLLTSIGRGVLVLLVGVPGLPFLRMSTSSVLHAFRFVRGILFLSA